MKKHEFTKYLLTSVAMIVTMTCQSCQPKSNPPTPRCPSTTNGDSDDRKMNRERNYQEEESNEETMRHVIEIEQPETPSVTEQKAPESPKVEVPAEAPMEASVVPAAEPVAEPVSTPAAETATAESAPATEAASLESAPAAVTSQPVEAVVMEVQPVNTSDQK